MLLAVVLLWLQQCTDIAKANFIKRNIIFFLGQLIQLDQIQILYAHTDCVGSEASSNHMADKSWEQLLWQNERVFLFPNLVNQIRLILFRTTRCLLYQLILSVFMGINYEINLCETLDMKFPFEELVCLYSGPTALH